MSKTVGNSALLKNTIAKAESRGYSVDSGFYPSRIIPLYFEADPLSKERYQPARAINYYMNQLSWEEFKATVEGLQNDGLQLGFAWHYVNEAWDENARLKQEQSNNTKQLVATFRGEGCINYTLKTATSGNPDIESGYRTIFVADEPQTATAVSANFPAC